ncbi:MAG: VacJ [Legionellales bacterium]|nr:VacJ [Legionellales bacterium]|tara:strand:- start:132 stop:485 length:354 start_codon:yes stop_codon:yes gene_type:complete
MFVVDRIVAILRPTDKMLHWIKDLPNAPDIMTIKNLQTDCTALLLPPFESPRQADAYIKGIYEGIFESELISWGVPKEEWPENRTYPLFKQWFNTEFHSVLFDIAFLEEEKKRNAAG